MFRILGKSKIALLLAILFGISLFFFRGGSRYSNLLNSDNVVAKVSHTPISTTKFNRTLSLNLNQFSQMLGKKITSKEIREFQFHTMTLSALINNAVFENEYDQKNFIIDEKIIAKKTKERLPKLYNENNKINNEYLNQLLKEESLKIEDIVQIIDFETRDNYFNEAFFKISYPKDFIKKIDQFDNHIRKISFLKIPFKKIKDNDYIEPSIDLDKEIKDFYENNINNYMTNEVRKIEFYLVNKKEYSSEFIPDNNEIKEYYEKNIEMFIERENRSFVQINFKKEEDANNFKSKIENLNNFDEVISYADKKNVKYNIFDNLTKEDVLDEISQPLFNLKINEQSNVIVSPLASHIIVLKNIIDEKQLLLKDVKDRISKIIQEIELNNYFSELNDNISKSILDGYSMKKIGDEFNLELKNIDDLTKNYQIKDKENTFFYESLIQNSFNSNKDFVSDVIKLNPDSFYLFNIKDIEVSKPKELIKIRNEVQNDWSRIKKAEFISKKVNDNSTNQNLIKQLSNEYLEEIKSLEIDRKNEELPNELLIKIFDNDKNSNVSTVNKDHIIISYVEEIKMSEIKTMDSQPLSLANDIRVSFGEELYNNVEITTNDNLINAVIDSY